MAGETTVTQNRIDSILSRSKVDVVKLGQKTTVMCVTLPNGFEVVASSACVNPANYNEMKGIEICRDIIVKKLWELEGYLLQVKLDEANDHA